MDLLKLKVSVAENVLSQKIGDEYVLYNMNEGTYFGLDDVGAEMWNALTTQPTIRHSFDVLLEKFDVESDRLKNDVRAFLDSISEGGLVRVTTLPEAE